MSGNDIATKIEYLYNNRDDYHKIQKNLKREHQEITNKGQEFLGTILNIGG